MVMQDGSSDRIGSLLKPHVKRVHIRLANVEFLCMRMERIEEEIESVRNNYAGDS
jgi:hypothetical protein